MPQRAAGVVEEGEVEEGEVARARRVQLSTSRLILWMWVAEPTSSPRVVLVWGRGGEGWGVEEGRCGGGGVEEGRGGGDGIAVLEGLLLAMVVLSLSMEVCRPPMEVSRSAIELWPGGKGGAGEPVVSIVWT